MKPVLQALLLADHVYVDKATGKHIVAGIFNSLYFTRALEMPVLKNKEGSERMLVPGGASIGSPCSYLSLTDVRGRQAFALRYVRLDHNAPVFELEFSLPCDNPLQTIELAFPLPQLPVQPTGVYALELLWENELLGSHRIQVQELPDNRSETTDRAFECPVLLYPEESGGFSIISLNLPGAASQGDTREEAVKNIIEALQGVIGCYLADDGEIPWEPVDVEDRPAGAIELRLLVNA